MHDNQGFMPLMRMPGDRVRAVVADKGHDADVIRPELHFNGIEAVIPPKSSRKTPILYDHDKYKDRNQVERLFNPLKNWLRTASRYNESANRVQVRCEHLFS